MATSNVLQGQPEQDPEFQVRLVII